MKAFCVIGYSKTGKTTTVTNIIAELKRRGYSVASIKDIHFEAFTMERENSDSWKHWNAGAETIIARGLKETFQIWHDKLSLQEMVSKIDADYLVIEGMKTAPLPKIISAETSEQIEELQDSTAFAISGKISNDTGFHHCLPVFNSLERVKDLVDLIEARTPDILPLLKDGHCGACGTSCYAVMGNHLTGKGSLSACQAIQKKNTTLSINGQNVQMINYVENTFHDVITAFVSNLKGGEKISAKCKIKIEIEE